MLTMLCAVLKFPSQREANSEVEEISSVLFPGGSTPLRERDKRKNKKEINIQRKVVGGSQ